MPTSNQEQCVVLASLVRPPGHSTHGANMVPGQTSGYFASFWHWSTLSFGFLSCNFLNAINVELTSGPLVFSLVRELLVMSDAFEKNENNWKNFLEWYRNLRIVLSTEDKLPFLEQLIPVLPVLPQGQANPPDFITQHQAWVKAQKEITGAKLMTWT
ncbi:hypothetical protein Tco_0554458 [Tanacetum coccineum]